MHVQVFVHAFNFVLCPSNARMFISFLNYLGPPPHSPVSAHLFDSHSWFDSNPPFLTPPSVFWPYTISSPPHPTSTLTHLSRTAIHCRHWFLTTTTQFWPTTPDFDPTWFRQTTPPTAFVPPLPLSHQTNKVAQKKATFSLLLNIWPSTGSRGWTGTFHSSVAQSLMLSTICHASDDNEL